MDDRSRRVQSDIYTEDQIKRVLIGSGITIQSEVDSDYIIFCPYHNNNRTPAGEVSKESGLFFCFGCQQVANLQELVMKMSLRAWLFLKDEYPMTIPYTKKDKKSGDYILKTTVYSLVPAKRFAKGLPGEIEFL